MPSQKNINTLIEIKDKLNKSKSVVFADYMGLNVKQISDLRKKVKESGAEFKVLKNTLLRLGLKELGWKIEEGVVLKELSGPTAVLFGYEDEIAPLKALYDFSQENELPKIKFGFLTKDFLTGEKIISLAKLPSKEVLLAKLVSNLSSPIYGLVYTLKGNLTKLVLVLNQIRKSKS